MTCDSASAANQLDLSFERIGRRTVLARRHVGYPFNVTAPLRSASLDTELIVQSVSGGIYGGESLGQRIDVGPGARVSVKMPSATVVHAARQGVAARQSVALHVAAGAVLCYLPRPLILFPGGALRQVTDVTVAGDAAVVIRDGFMMHDPQSMPPAARRLDSRVTVRDEAGRLIAMDVAHADDAVIDAACPGVTDAFRAFGAVWLVQHLQAPHCQVIKSAIARRFVCMGDCYVSTSALRGEGGVVVRVAAADGGVLDAALDMAVGTVRDAMHQRPSADSLEPGLV
ncbi:urease accessory protein UreD [Vineibacter terrae]|uniref:urease accessory protein UreD n=1 Tax=Vineibacter terrae TaxID=2586908 RepID=UPI002E379013|nr:urease accessory protein UreD [Vineibacter terrae]HEX2886594.1 urease accessory protein UreD [Vineibacter terrae]